jgi:hypothetical protein
MMTRLMCACLLCLESNTSAATQPQPPQIPPLAVHLIDKLIVAFKQTAPGISAARVDVLRDQLLAMASETESLNFTIDFSEAENSHSLDAELFWIAQTVVIKINEAAKANENDQNAEALKATHEIYRLVIKAYVLVGIGNATRFPHVIAATIPSTAVQIVAIVIASLPQWQNAQWPMQVFSVVFAGNLVLVPYIIWNVGRADQKKMPRLYPDFLKNIINLTLNRNAVDAKFWRIVAKNLRALAGSDPGAIEFLNDWLPGYQHNRFWSTTARGLRSQDTSPLQRFFETLQRRFPPPRQSDCSALLDNIAS